MPPAVALIRLLLSLLFITAISADQNVTVDDTFGDPITGEQFVYKPASGGSIPAWNVGQDCPGCFAQPDPDQTYLHTWHDGTTGIMTPMSASINFEGTALYVYCILVHSAVDSYFTTNTNLSFSIDGEVVGSFLDNSPVPAGSNSTYNYNVLVYSIDNLPHAQHSFTLTNGNLSLALLDKVVYT
ncbi:hypothetical protein OBBRIDRAFT_718250 [Obba rivulosa]|uniref:Uncharacterized protein n=1 Tax=Obba rivulosa TaxID=1052685 RepID=A0A8E2DV67_9APHY|nr:hypothetical protein OBBRIDRAFT_718250 [Obba rivulosa]